MAKGDIVAFLGVNTAYHGQLSFTGTIIIDGEFSGEIKSDGMLTVGKEGRVHGQINVGILDLKGFVDADVVVSKKTTMSSTARFQGNIVTPLLEMEEGAILQGKVQMLNDPVIDGKTVVVNKELPA